MRLQWDRYNQSSIYSPYPPTWVPALTDRPRWLLSSCFFLFCQRIWLSQRPPVSLGKAWSKSQVTLVVPSLRPPPGLPTSAPFWTCSDSDLGPGRGRDSLEQSIIGLRVLNPGWFVLLLLLLLYKWKTMMGCPVYDWLRENSYLPNLYHPMEYSFQNEVYLNRLTGKVP